MSGAPIPGLEGLERFVVTLDNHVATVTMNAPPVNAQDRVFRDELPRIFDVLHDRPEVRAVVLTGRGAPSPPGPTCGRGRTWPGRPAPIPATTAGCARPSTP
ncbi:hypothetical protein [Roseomonas marmotae]|uniref:hypothetical protein n=1 Tax=Roseomonas marmotae TaxID=2768161 RepID=UPI003013E6CA